MVTRSGQKVEVPFIDLEPQYREIETSVRAAINEVIESQHFILGTTVRRFEERMEGYLHCRFGTGVASGSDALLLSLMALDIGPGDAVLVPSFTFFSTVSCIIRVGATPVFVEIDPRTLLLSAEELRHLLSRCDSAGKEGTLRDPRSKHRLRALIPVHLFGQCCNMPALLSIARRHHLQVIEDVAQALGSQGRLSTGETRHAGTLGDVGCFSFFPTKNLGTFGDGGFLATHDAQVARKLKALRVHGEIEKYRHEYLGINSRLDAIQAAVLGVKLDYLDRWCQERIRLAGRYGELFRTAGLAEDEVKLPRITSDGSHVYNYFVIRSRQRDALRRFLGECGIQTEIYYPVPIHMQPCFSALGYGAGDFPASEQASSEVLAIPFYPGMRATHQENVVQRISDFHHRPPRSRAR